jgi:hypothetical protein
MKLILAILFAFLALSMGFRSRLNSKNFMQTNTMLNDICSSGYCDGSEPGMCYYFETSGTTDGAPGCTCYGCSQCYDTKNDGDCS